MTPRELAISLPDDFDDAESLRRIAHLVIALLMAGMPVDVILRRLTKEPDFMGTIQ